MDKASNRHLIWYIVILAFVLRAGLAFTALALNKDKSVFCEQDTIEYILPAQSLVATGSYETNGEPEIFRTPGYSLCFIPGIMTGYIELVTVALQIVLSCLTVFLVYRLGLLLFESEDIGLLAAALLAIEPTAVMFAPLLLSDTVYAAVLTLCFYTICRYMKTGAVSDLGISAILLAASAYIRPISVYVPIIVALVLGVRSFYQATRFRKLLMHSAVFLVVSMGLIGLWHVRNLMVSGYGGFSVVSANNLYFLLQGGILAEQNGISCDEQQLRMGCGRDQTTYFALHPEQRTWPQCEVYRYMSREGIKTALACPQTHMVLFSRSLMKTLRDTGSWWVVRWLGYDPDSPEGIDVIRIIRIPLFALLLAYWGLFVVGCFSRRWVDGWQMLVLAFVCLYLMLAPAALNIGYNRFRYPATPVMCLMAGCGLRMLLDRFGFPSLAGGSETRRA